MTRLKTAKVIKFHEENCNGCLECMKACSMIHFKTKDGGEKSAIKIFKSNGKYKEAYASICALSGH